MKEISVMIVDDSEIDCYLLERELESTKYDVFFTQKHNGLRAVEFFEQYEENIRLLGDKFPPLIIFLDVNMPLMDGLGFLEKYSELRSNALLQSSVVMMFTSSKNPKDIQSSLEYDFVNGYIVKGEYTAEGLEEVIDKLVCQDEI